MSGEGRVTVFCMWSSVWDDGRVLEMYSGDGCTTLSMDSVLLHIHLKMVQMVSFMLHMCTTIKDILTNSFKSDHRSQVLE